MSLTFSSNKVGAGAARVGSLIGVLAAAALAAAVLVRLELDWTALFSGDLAEASRALERAAARGGPWTAGWLLLLAALLPFAFVPMTAVNVAAAALLPAPLAVAVIIAGDSLNAALAWIAGKLWGEPLLRRLGGERWGAIRLLRQGASRHGFWIAVLSRFIPSPFVLQAAAGAAAGISAGAMVLGTAAAMLPWALVYVFALEAVKKGELGSLGPALALLALVGALGWQARRRLARPAQAEPASPPLRPRQPPRGPELTFYTMPGDPACLEARQQLARLRDEIGFEVREVDLSDHRGPEAGLQDHVPVVFAGAERIFSFQIDAHALAKHVEQLKQRTP